MNTPRDKTLDNINALHQRAKLSGLCQQAVTCSRQGNQEMALAILDQVLQINTNIPEAYSNRGLVLRRLGRQEEALVVLEQALKNYPDFATLHFYRGLVLTDMGRLDEAMSGYRRAVELRPNYAEAYHYMTMVQKTSADDAIVATMEQLYKNTETTPDSRVSLGFALGKVYNDSGNYDKAACYYQKANRLNRESLRYNEKEYTDFSGYLYDLFTPEYFARNTGTGIADDSPVFIVGMPRSGTTLLEQILASHPEIEGAGEVPFISQLACQQGAGLGRNCFAWLKEPSNEMLKNTGNEYLRRLRKCGGLNAHYITDKMLSNFWFIGFIHLILPKARIINVRRDARDNCLSVFTNHFDDNIQYAYDLAELGRYYRLHTSVMNHWNKVLPGLIYETSYESLVVNLEDEVRRLLDYCKLPFNEQCLKYYENNRAVQTVSFTQVRKPLYKNSVGRWKSYEKMLQPLVLALEGG